MKFQRLLLALLLLCATAHSAMALQVTLSWTYVQGSVSATSFVMYRAPGCTGSFAAIGEVAWPTVTFVDATVTVGNTYCWQVTAKAASGLESPPSNTVSLPLSPPATPTGLSGQVSP